MNFYLDLNDKRLPFVSNLLKEAGENTCVFNFENCTGLNKGDVVVLSPAFKWNEAQAQKLSSEISVVCGKVSEEVLKIFNSKKIKYFNLMSDEDFVLKNAILTAEGTLADIILNTNKSIFDCKILILGSGRVAKAVAVLLSKLGLNFDMTMRDNFKLLESQLVCTNIVEWKDYKSKLKNYDIVINTIPVQLFEESDSQKFKAGSALFELASIKCLQGFEPEHFKYVFCPALPSKYTPESAGKLIYQYLLKNIKGEN